MVLLMFCFSSFINAQGCSMSFCFLIVLLCVQCSLYISWFVFHECLLILGCCFNIVYGFPDVFHLLLLIIYYCFIVY